MIYTLTGKRMWLYGGRYEKAGNVVQETAEGFFRALSQDLFTSIYGNNEHSSTLLLWSGKRAPGRTSNHILYVVWPGTGSRTSQKYCLIIVKQNGLWKPFIILRHFTLNEGQESNKPPREIPRNLQKIKEGLSKSFTPQSNRTIFQLQ